MPKAQKQRWGLIYKLTAPNGKYYYGKTTTKFRKRMSNHKSDAFNTKKRSYNGYLQRAIRKYGWENFKKEILVDEVPEEDLDNLEISYIKIHNATNRKYGYNLTAGGNGGSLSEATKKKMSESQKKLQANREQFGSLHFDKSRKKWRVYSARPEYYYIGHYLTEEKARRALKLYNESGEVLPSDCFRRKKGIGTINKRLNGKYQATLVRKKKRYNKTFDTVDECERWLKTFNNKK